MVPFYPSYPDRTRLINYLPAMISTANDYGAIYSTGKNNEGILILTDTTHPYSFTASLKMVSGILKALSFKGSKSIMDKFQSGGESLEKNTAGLKRILCR